MLHFYYRKPLLNHNLCLLIVKEMSSTQEKQTMIFRDSREMAQISTLTIDCKHPSNVDCLILLLLSMR